MSLLTAFRKRASPHVSTGVFTASRLACSALGMLGGLLTVRLVAPATLGFFNTVSIGQGYLTWLNLGIFTGLNRELPYFYGKGDPEKANEMAATAQFWAGLLGGITFAGFTVAGVISWFLGKHWLGAALLANAIMAFTSFYNGYLNITFRTKHDFVKLAVIDVSVSALAICLLVLVWIWNFYGVCLRFTLIPLASLILLFTFRPVKVRTAWSTANFRHLIATGLPIYMAAQVYAWWNGSLTPTWVAWKCGTEAMGLYAFVTFTYVASAALTGSISQVYYPRLVENYAKFHDLPRLFCILRKPVVVLLLANLLALAAGWCLMPYAIRWLAPKYGGATMAAQCALFSCILSAAYPVFSIFPVIKKVGIYLVCTLIGISIHLFVLLVLFKGQRGLHFFVIAELIGKTGFSLACLVALYRLRKQTTVPQVS